jgi:hypothetical protein
MRATQVKQHLSNSFLVDDDPGDRAHVLAFDRDHPVSEALDDLALLVGREDVLDERDVDERDGPS